MNGAELRIIKKYPNRRLYDTAISSYITLEDVRRLVVEQIPIKIIDARTQEDISHSTFLQIIIEQEEKGPPLFTIDSLQQMIRSYGGHTQQILSKLFEQGMNFFTQQQENLKKSLEKYAEDEKEPLQLMADLIQKNMLNWQQIQQQWLESFTKVCSQSDENENTRSTVPLHHE